LCWDSWIPGWLHQPKRAAVIDCLWFASPNSEFWHTFLWFINSHFIPDYCLSLNLISSYDFEHLDLVIEFFRRIVIGHLNWFRVQIATKTITTPESDWM
jgi:hypothetical protein